MGRRKKESFTKTEEICENKVYLNAGEIEELIQKLEKKINSTDKRTKEFSILVDEINLLFETYNKEIGYKAYKKI